MEKSELLYRLRTIESSLPTEGIETENKPKIIDSVYNGFIKSYERLMSFDSGVVEYDEEAIESERLKIESLRKERKVVKEILEKSRSQYAILSEEIENMQKAIDVEYPEIIKNHELLLKKYDNTISKSSPNLSESLIKIRDKEFERIQSIKNQEKALRKKLASKKDRLLKIQSLIQQRERITKELSLDIEDVKRNLDELQKGIKPTSEERENLELKAEVFYRTYEYLSKDPKTELNNIIARFEKGELTEEQVKSKLIDIKGLLNSELYDTEEIKTPMTPETLENHRAIISSRINELREKLADDSNYMERTDKYDADIDNIIAYKEMIDDIEREKTKIQMDSTERKSLIKSNINKINKCRRLLEEAKTEKESVMKSKLSAAEKSKKIKLIDSKVKEIEAKKKDLINQNLRIASIDEETEKDIYIANSRQGEYQKRIGECRKRLYSINETERERDIRELEEQEALLFAAHTNADVLESPLLTELDSLIELTSIKGKGIEPEEDTPVFVKKFTPEQKKLYEDIMMGLSPDEAKEIEEKAEEKHKKVAPIAPPKKHKVRKFKEAPKEFWDKVGTWFKKNWGKVVAGAIVASLLVAVSISAFIKPQASPATEVVTITQTLPKDFGTTNNIPAAEVTPEIPEAEVEPTIPDKPKDPATPKDPGQPTTPETPEVTPPVIEDKTYVLATEVPAGTGDSYYADPTVARLDGESVVHYDETTGIEVNVDSEGTKITKLADGSTVVERGAEEVTPNTATTVKITNPDMTPGAEESKLPEAKTIEAAVADGSITSAEAAKAQEFFDTQFGQINQDEQTKGLGGL